MKHPLRLMAIGVGVLVALFGTVLALTVKTDPRADQNRSNLVGKQAPNIVVTTTAGAAVHLDDYQGRAVLVNFWNTWCIPCRQEAPALTAWNKDHAGDSSVVMLGIVREDTDTAVRSYVKTNKVSWPIGLDPSGAAALAFGTRGQPETYAVSPSGMIIGSYYGPATEKILDQMVAAAREAG